MGYCTSCQGTGNIITESFCASCSGKGYLEQWHQPNNSNVQMWAAPGNVQCNQCHGSGRVSQTRYGQCRGGCNGSGFIPDAESPFFGDGASGRDREPSSTRERRDEGYFLTAADYANIRNETDPVVEQNKQRGKLIKELSEEIDRLNDKLRSQTLEAALWEGRFHLANKTTRLLGIRVLARYVGLDADATILMARCWIDEYGLLAARGTALELLEKASKLGSSEADFRMGGLLLTDSEGAPSAVEDVVRAIQCLRRASDAGNPLAMGSLANFYLTGELPQIEKDFELAARWARKAAEAGDCLGQFMMGIMHNDGVGVEQDLNKAFKWIELAANQKHAEAQRILGLFYAHGHGVEADISAAKRWLTMAVKNGNALAGQALAQLSQ